MRKTQPDIKVNNNLIKNTNNPLFGIYVKYTFKQIQNLLIY